MLNTYYNPVHTYQGEGCLKLLPELIEQAAPEEGTVLLLLCREELSQDLEQWMPKNRTRTEVFPHSNPDLEQLFQIYQKTKDWDVRLVVAAGGGSTLDVGKSLCCLYGKEIGSIQELRKLIEEKKYKAPACRWIGVPTTAGTGSEVTCWATIWYPQAGIKYSLDCAKNYAYAAVADPQLLVTMPAGLAVSSALDTVAHAVESYWAKATNMVSKALALSAMEGIMERIDELTGSGNRSQAFQAMSLGSMLAGLAFSNTRTTGCHSISYPLTMGYQIPHGVAVSLLLGPVLKLNQEQIPDLEPLLRALGVSGAEELEERICSILTRAGFPVRLKGWGAKQEDIPDLAAHSITKGRADNNPAQLTEERVTQILNHIL